MVAFILASRKRLFDIFSRVGAQRVPRCAPCAARLPIGGDFLGTGGFPLEAPLGIPTRRPDLCFTVFYMALFQSAFMPKTCSLNEVRLTVLRISRGGYLLRGHLIRSARIEGSACCTHGMISFNTSLDPQGWARAPATSCCGRRGSVGSTTIFSKGRGCLTGVAAGVSAATPAEQPGGTP